MKRIVCEHTFTPEQLHLVHALARSVGITATTAGILYARGMDSEEKMRAFLSPSRRHFLPPELMSGMREAKELLTRARDEEWRVAIFGDYDADGVGACAILFRALREFGIEAYLYVPERSEGYGLSVGAIDKIFDEFLPDLIVTVDCGISCAREVQYIRQLGAFVIVTDHHELPETLPDCICVNPKFQDDYPYDNLCGAGVAYKLAYALIGERANALLDFCALSTVADSVPLLGENRDIVQEGLSLIRNNQRPAFSALCGGAEEITAQTLAFTIAPRVNAAGRMGDARAALRLFTTDDEEEIALLAEKLNLYNLERQKLCDSLYESARDKIVRDGAYGNVVFAMDEDWQSGLVGIAAARIAEEFSRPALLFVKRGDMLRGSARSVENVNIYEALRACSDYIEEFGGHSQAAGLNVKAENFDKLKAALDAYIGERYTREELIPALYVSEKLGDESPVKLARELALLEPFGVGNRRPLFTVQAEELNASPVKPLSPHVSIAGENLNFMYFGGEKELRLLKSDIPKTLVFEYNLSKFRGREYLKGFVRSVIYDGSKGASLDLFENAVLSRKTAYQTRFTSCSENEIANMLEERKDSFYGVCVIAYRRSTLARFSALSRFPVEAFTPSSGNVQSVILLAPDPGLDLSAFREIFFLETPSGIPVKTGGAQVYINRGETVFGSGDTIPTREELLQVFASLRKSGIEGATYSEAAKRCRSLGFDPELFVFALAVFEELGLIDRTDGKMNLVRGVKTDLNASAIYTGSNGLSGG